MFNFHSTLCTLIDWWEMKWFSWMIIFHGKCFSMSNKFIGQIFHLVQGKHNYCMMCIIFVTFSFDHECGDQITHEISGDEG